MKKISRLFVFLLFVSTSLSAQKVYFIYLQTENQQPFYARVGEKVHNSSSAGYLILSKLHDSTYSLNIGIQGSQLQDQPYAVTINKKDQGFVIKNFGEKGWGLFNLGTMAVTMPAIVSANPIQAVKTEKRESNSFTDLLAKAADDSTIKEKPIMVKAEEKKVVEPPVVIEKKEEPKIEIKETIPPKQEEVKKETNIVEKKPESKNEPIVTKVQNLDTSTVNDIKVSPPITTQNEIKEMAKQDSVKKEEPIVVKKSEPEIETEVYKISTVKLKSESSTTVGIGLVFLDMFSVDKVDTIRILIPATETKKITSIETKQEEKKFLDIPPADTVRNETVKNEVKKNNKCNQLATNDDFFNLRRKMAGETSDDNMISEASKEFKTKCYTTQQIKNLSTLFLSDEYKYKFFDTAYLYTSDTGSFSSLESELKDAYYVNRFKAMLRQ